MNLYLNRFYNQIDGVKEVVMVSDILLLVGEIESMAIWHSVTQ